MVDGMAYCARWEQYLSSQCLTPFLKASLLIPLFNMEVELYFILNVIHNLKLLFPGAICRGHGNP